MRLERQLKKKALELRVGTVMSSADVRAMRAAGLDPEYVENERGKVSSRIYYSLLRERDAVRVHLSWLQNDLKKGRIILNENYHSP